MANFSTFLENSLVGHLLSKAAYTEPASIWLAFYTTAVTFPAGTGGVEVTTGQVTNYVRTQILAASLNAAAGGAITNSAAITMPNSSGGTGASVVGWAILDASTAGNILIGGAVTFTWSTGVQPIVPSGSFSASIA